MLRILATSSTLRGLTTKGVAPRYRCRKSVRYAATSPAESSQLPGPTAVLSSASVAELGGRGIDALGPAVAYRRGYGLQVPDQSEKRHHLQQIKCDVEFPPIKALTHRRRIVMVIVVPALAQRNDREPRVVAAGIAGLVALSAEHVRERVDGVCAVVNQHGRYEESPDQHLPARGMESRRNMLQQHAEQE